MKRPRIIAFLRYLRDIADLNHEIDTARAKHT